jgi:hypothetical protein
MRLSKTAFWASGILILFFYLGLNRGMFLLDAKHTTGECIGSHQYTGRHSSGGRSYNVRFVYEGSVYTFWTSRFASANRLTEVPVIFNPDDPEDAYEDSFGGFWLWGLIWVAIIFVPWSAAALSIVGSDERFVISRKKIGLEKIRDRH